MSFSNQRVSPGRLESSYRRELDHLIEAKALHQIWSKQPSLWTSDPEHARVISNRLGWIGVLDAMRASAGELAAFAGETREAGLRDLVLLGMGGSSLAPEVFSLMFPAPADGRRFFVLDSTDPASILAVERAIDPHRTLFVVASKSGKTLETLSQFYFFLHRTTVAGTRPAGRNFVGITDAGSYLAQLGLEYGFRRTFLNPADIGGRYSALSYFGLVPAALWGVNVNAVLDSAIEMRAACDPAEQTNASPALELGALLGVGGREGADKLVLLSTPALAPLSNWIEQLVAESTGKEGKGVVPVAGGAFPAPEVLAEGCVVAALRLEGESASRLDATLDALRPQGVPLVEIRLAEPAELGGEFFKWEVATAVAGAILGINPFDEPNVQESKDATAHILEQFQATGQIAPGIPRLAEKGIELYTVEAVRHSISASRLPEALRSFLALRKPGDYLALLAYVDRSETQTRPLEALRATLSDRLRLPVLLGYGPRYLHSIGQLFKGGLPTGLFLILTAAKEEDLAIPGANYSFGQLQMAQAIGDFESLGRRGRPALRLHLTQGVGAGLTELRRVVETAVAASPSASR